MQSLDGSDRSKVIVDRVAARFDAAGNGENGYLSRVSIAAADAHALSAPLVTKLVAAGKASLGKPDRDFEDSENARVLAHAMGQVPAADRPSVYRLITLIANDVTAMAGSNAEMYATLARRPCIPRSGWTFFHQADLHEPLAE